jgi:hypothetical protein
MNKLFSSSVFQMPFALLLFGSAANVYANDGWSTTYTDLVDKKGNISLPKGFQTNWVFLGTWSVAISDIADNVEAQSKGAAALHNVYTQPGVAEYYRENKAFPDGAVLLKELRKGVTSAMTTGIVSRAADLDGWFIMIKDTKRRFPSNPLWGNGWGWALFNADQPRYTVTRDKGECIACHVPAKKNDWVYIEGYPLLQSEFK